MTQLICELGSDDEFFVAIKTLLKLYTDSQKKAELELRVVSNERDSLLAKVRALQDVLSHDIHASPVDGGSRRKRPKITTTANISPCDLKSVSISSVQNDTNDDLMNVAFNSTAAEEDEVIAATQLNQSKPDLHKTKTPNEHSNKENTCAKRMPVIFSREVEKSPTVLTKRTTRITATKQSNDRAATPERVLSPKKDINQILRTPSSSSSRSPRTKAKRSATKTPRRLFDNWAKSPSTKRSPASPQRPKPNTSFRSKLCLSNPPTRLKQSTLKFTKVGGGSNSDETFPSNAKNHNDETFYDDSSFQSMGETTRQAFSEELHQINIKIEHADNKSDKTHYDPSENHLTCDSSSDSVEEVPADFNAVIVLDDTEVSPHLMTTKASVSKSPTADAQNIFENVAGVGCKECEDYHRMLGRDLTGKNAPERFGVCSKHRRNNPCPDTPPGFWNPKIMDTPENERNETPYDYRFVNSKE